MDSTVLTEMGEKLRSTPHPDPVLMLAALKLLRLGRGDSEVAHILEDEMHYTITRWATSIPLRADGMTRLEESACIAHKSHSIKFSRWHA